MSNEGMGAPEESARVKTTSSTDEYDSNICMESGVLSSTATDARRAVILKEFAGLLGTQSSNEDIGIKFKSLYGLLSTQLDDDDVVLTLPSLDLRLSDADASILPEVGKISGFGAQRLDGKSSDSVGRPTMAASVLNLATDGKANIEQKAAQNIGKQTSWTKSTLRYASGAVATNISESFIHLVDARVKAWTLLLLRHSLSTGDSQSRSRLLNILSAKIKGGSVKTNFKTLPLPPSAAGKPKEADVVLPLLFEANIEVSIQDKCESVLIRAPGTISALFLSEMGLKKVMIRLDTGVVVSALVEQARIVVLKAVASVTKTSVATSSLPTPLPQIPPTISEEEPTHDSSSHVSAASLASLRSALNLSHAQVDMSPRLEKARSSALKLNNVLHGKSSEGRIGTSTGLRKVRSVKWEEPVQAPKLGPSLAPNPKKLRLVETACKLKSFKSFGRPHADDFGSGPRNATFGAFGGSAGVWGRDGRLAHHPRPMMASLEEANGLTGVADKNAKFDLRPSSGSKPSENPLFNNILRSQLGLSSTPSQSQSQSSSLPRTATALENSLLNQWS